MKMYVIVNGEDVIPILYETREKAKQVSEYTSSQKFIGIAMPKFKIVEVEIDTSFEGNE